MTDLWFDENRDLATIKPRVTINGTFKIEPTKEIACWNRKADCVGLPSPNLAPRRFLQSGISVVSPLPKLRKVKLPSNAVVDGAFNPGNSEALISPEGNNHRAWLWLSGLLLLPAGLASALKALGDNKYGMQFGGTQDGKPVTYSNLRAHCCDTGLLQASEPSLY